VNLGKYKQVLEVVSRLRESDRGELVRVDGGWGSFAPVLAGHIANELGRVMVFVSSHIEDADNAAEELSVFSGQAVDVFPAWEDSGCDLIDAADEIAAERLRVALALRGVEDNRAKGDSKTNSGAIISTCVQALSQGVPGGQRLVDKGLRLAVGETSEPGEVCRWLIDNGFERVDQVEGPGQFAQRGGIVDIFAAVTTAEAVLGRGPGNVGEPLRVEFFGDEVDSIRTINLDTQRSGAEVYEVTILGGVAKGKGDEGEQFVNLLPDDAIIVLDDPVSLQEVSQVFLARAQSPERLFKWADIYNSIRKFTVLEVSGFSQGKGDEHSISFDVRSCQEFEHIGSPGWQKSSESLDKLIEQCGQYTVELYCDNAAQMKRVSEIVEQTAGRVVENFKVCRGFVRRGFIFEPLKTIVISHQEVFGQSTRRRRIRAVGPVKPLDNILDLHKGDYVVHINYGIGKFVGTELIERKGRAEEYLTLEYAGKVKVHIRASNINLIQKYIGAAATRPKLSRIGTKQWERQKARVAKGVNELAEELLEIQARRQARGGFAFGDDTLWQEEFEESFEYEETPDQLSSIKQVKADMARAVPMDRLLCGDVGYGKTEIAMRATFKAIEAGKQVAVLVPTTVLCVQHGRSFAERFADFPVRIEILNRFVSARKAKEVIADCKAGRVDILIGTHRLLSGDVGFKDLGLVIIDEEQRFGVEHKERLKRFRVNVDILTMTATPIPRTLHMSMLGLRDISSLSTPPLDRRSIVTRVARFSGGLIKRAIMDEINRGGQVFFVHNRVQSIEQMAMRVRDMIGDEDIVIDVAHGQMHKHELEKAMLRFVSGATDVLVCSTIIESGLDIPNANTMIINRSDRFGLAQLHQLRGRVGRYKHRAYAYMLLPENRPVSPTAAKRLKAIEEYSQLGAGFRIALRDLQIRGAGNILGPEQSGHINTVGYELYCKLLAEAVKKARGEEVEKVYECALELGFSASIPKNYIPIERQRMEAYRKIAEARDSEALEQVGEELADMFGPLPGEVRLLIDMAEIRMLGSKAGIKSIEVREPDIIFRFEREVWEPSDSDPQDFKTDKKIGDMFADGPGKVSVPDKGVVYLRLGSNYFQRSTLLTILRKILRKGGDD
jgi:transcription-repair coupling factor (superfamily II helicase)